MDMCQKTVQKEQMVMDNAYATITFWEAEAANALPPLMDADLKEQVAEEGRVFTVHDIREAETTYGLAWMIELDLDGERWTLPLSKTPFRDGQLQRMRDHL